jgi:hypothetical protein
MSYRRWLALCGVAAPLLIILAIVAVGGNSPQDDASPEKVMTFYRGHLTATRISGLMVAIGAVLLVLFAARLRELLRDGSEVFSLAAFGGAVLGSAAFMFAVAVHFSVADAADNQFVEQAHTLNVLDNDSLIAAVFGMSVMFLAAGIAIVSRPVLPRWLGWAAIVIGVVSLAGPIGFIAAALGLVWLLVVGIIMFLHADDTTEALVEVVATAVEP